ncbi:DUF2238 domain-containing protein [Limibaculum sp. M0105]|uniref:DUF2238 domain-containing protein n=1 Tax=Thermohalobaculum xanthum TaxID=2753746 RepID=A0A8J7MAX9_9RHOB|nr:DUF2238 domain-containing protein [Thermohalobaculum xanthum]MBK0400938.1 DUF2238 domain-containing protein [Thermohalobaculum xanthum]
MRPPSPAEWWVIAFNLGYLALFTTHFLARGNAEFLWYIVTMAVLMGLVWWLSRRVLLPVPLMWALSLWGFAHMAGGGVPVGETVLYGVTLVPLVADGDLTLLRYDQVVHAYGFAVTAWLVWRLAIGTVPAMRGTRTVLVLAALSSMGLGATNEIVEFAAVVALPQTGVGGYYNTALDLVFNAMGAVLAVLAIAAVERNREG